MGGPDPVKGPGWEPILSAGLLILTLLSTLVAGALLVGVDPLGLEFRTILGIPFWWPTGFSLVDLLKGIPFAVPFVAILYGHEWGHRWAADRHGVVAGPPLLIPFPPHISVVGTLGGLVRLHSPIPHRRALLDVGASGPLISLVLSLPCLMLGLLLSEVTEVPARDGLPFIIVFQDIVIRLGEPLLVGGLLAILPVSVEEAALHLHPLAFAGWVGLILTFLNLLPLGQLDGGQILYALHPGRQRWWSRATVSVFLVLGFMWPGWWAWAVITFVLGRNRTIPLEAMPPHPAPTGWRKVTGWLLMGSLILLLPPIPVSF